MPKLYLYGKFENLNNVIKGTKGLWFRDIQYYKKLENINICENEDFKHFKFPMDDRNILNVGGIELKGRQIKKFSLSIPTRRCHVLCLSKKGNSQELFQHFKADICLQINFELLLSILRSTFGKIPGIHVLGKEITYADNIFDYYDISPIGAVFKKPKYFEKEHEFRIAIFYKHDDNTIANTGTHKLPLFGESDHIELNVGGERGIGIIFENIIYAKN